MTVPLVSNDRVFFISFYLLFLQAGPEPPKNEDEGTGQPSKPGDKGTDNPAEPEDEGGLGERRPTFTSSLSLLVRAKLCNVAFLSSIPSLSRFFEMDVGKAPSRILLF